MTTTYLMSKSFNKVCVTLLTILAIGIIINALNDTNKALLNRYMSELVNNDTNNYEKNQATHYILDQLCNLVYVSECGSINKLLGFDRQY